MTNLGTIVTVIDFGEHSIKIVKKIKQFLLINLKMKKTRCFTLFLKKQQKSWRMNGINSASTDLMGKSYRQSVAGLLSFGGETGRH